MRGGYGSDGAGSSEAEDERSAEESHSHPHSTARPFAYQMQSAPAGRINSAVFYYSAPAPYVQTVELADPEAAFQDETDYISSLYLFEFARRASIEVQE